MRIIKNDSKEIIYSSQFFFWDSDKPLYRESKQTTSISWKIRPVFSLWHKNVVKMCWIRLVLNNTQLNAGGTCKKDGIWKRNSIFGTMVFFFWVCPY